MVFDPKLESGIQPVGPTQQPSAFQAIAGFTSNLIDIGTSVAREEQKKDADRFDQETFSNWTQEIQKADALRKAGRPNEASRIESNALITASQRGLNVGSAQVKATYEAMTGRPADWAGLTQEQAISKDIVQTEEYRNSFLATFATNPEASTQEREQLAFNTLAVTNAATQTVQMKSLLTQENWAVKGEKAYNTVIDSFMSTDIGALNFAASQGQNLDPTGLERSFQKWQGIKGNLTKPSGVTSEQWAATEARIKAIDTMYDSLINRKETITSALASSFGSAVMADPSLGVATKYLLTASDPRVMIDSGLVNPADIKDALSAINGPRVELFKLNNPQADNDTGQPQDIFPKEMYDSVSGKDAKDLLKKSVNISKVIGTMNFQQLAGNPDMVKEFVNESMVAAAALQKMSFQFNDYASSGDINKVYDGSVLAGISAVRNVNPEAANTLLKQHELALDTQYTSGQAKLISASSGFLRWNDRTNQAELNLETIVTRYQGRAGFVGQIPTELNKALAEYNGDISALINDKGVRYQGGQNAAIKFFVNSEEARNLVGMSNELRSHREALQTIVNKRNQFRAKLQEWNPSGDAELKGYQGNDTLGTSFQTLYDMGVDPNELQTIFNKESFGGDPLAQNPNSSAVGLFQFTEVALSELGYDRQDILNMSPAEQAEVYKRYLKKWKWKPGIPLGMMQAAPAYASKPNSTVVYKEGSSEWEANPGWRPADGGDITVGSIKDYYEANS